MRNSVLSIVRIGRFVLGYLASIAFAMAICHFVLPYALVGYDGSVDEIAWMIVFLSVSIGVFALLTTPVLEMMIADKSVMNDSMTFRFFASIVTFSLLFLAMTFGFAALHGDIEISSGGIVALSLICGWGCGITYAACYPYDVEKLQVVWDMVTREGEKKRGENPWR